MYYSKLIEQLNEMQTVSPEYQALIRSGQVYRQRHRKHALSSVYPDVVIDYSKVKISMGSLESASGLSVALDGDGVRFNWLGSTPDDYQRGEDQTILLVYFPSLARAVYTLYGDRRVTGTALLAIPDGLLAERMEVYMAFVSADRTQVSESSYLGSLMINAIGSLQAHAHLKNTH